MTRLTPERQRELYTCVLDLVAEHGYDRLTMDQVATAARISKATLYRQWGSKPALVVEALKQIGPVAPVSKSTGSLRGDLRAWARSVTRDPAPETDLVVAVLHACKTDPQLHEGLRERLVASAREEFDQLFSQAIERGEIASDVPGLAHMPVVIAGALALSEIIDGHEVDRSYLYEYIDAVILPSLGAR